MGERAGFEEKEFETLANATFALQAPRVVQGMPGLFSPGQRLERTLGFDFSVYLDPTSTTYRLLFGAYPGGVVTPGATASPPTNLPPATKLVNSFIQYKRPMYFKRTHRQTVWQGQSFLRFEVRSQYTVNRQLVSDHRQLDALDRLASHIPAAKVRYACPSVWTRRDLYAQYASQSLISNSAFTDPRSLSHLVNNAHAGWHDYWTFSPLNPAVGHPNPSGPKRTVQTGEDFLHEVYKDVESQPGRDVREEVFKIQSDVKESRAESGFFHADSEIRGRTKAESVRYATDSMSGDFMRSPRGQDWLTRDYASNSVQATRPPRSDELEVIAATVEIAATARELNLAWITAME